MSNLIDKQAAIDLWDKYHPIIAVDAMQYDAELRQMPPAQPAQHIDADGTLWITVTDIEQVKRVIVDDGSLFCRQFYMDAKPERKKGKWIEYEQEFMLEGPLKTVQKTVRECSVCTAKIAGMVGIMNYCPNCGADMRGEKDG